MNNTLNERKVIHDLELSHIAYGLVYNSDVKDDKLIDEISDIFPSVDKLRIELVVKRVLNVRDNKFSGRQKT